MTYQINNRPEPKLRFGPGGLVTCGACEAQFNPEARFVRGVDLSEGTESRRFHPVHRVPRDRCPMCMTQYNELFWFDDPVT